MDKKRKDMAISDILGVIILLAITVTLFSVLSIIVLTYPFHPSAPSVDIVGMIDEDNINLSHRGGESLDLDTEIIVTIGEIRYNDTIEAYLDDMNNDSYWNIGEKVIYIPQIDLINKFVSVAVVDIESSTVIMRGTLQEMSS